MTDERCAHPNITRTVTKDGAYLWRCTKPGCKLEFIPENYVGMQAAAYASERIDMVTAVASAMLWDFHERAVERYGPQVAQAVAPPQEGEGMFEHTPDTCPQHEWNGGQCTICGASQWVGS